MKRMTTCNHATLSQPHSPQRFSKEKDFGFASIPRRAVLMQEYCEPKAKLLCVEKDLLIGVRSLSIVSVAHRVVGIKMRVLFCL